MKVTNHQFILSNPIKETDKSLILGTIHPHDVSSFKLPFFYGNRNSIWNIFRDVFPGELPREYSVEDIKNLLSNRNIAISDTILQCERVSDSALDKDLRPTRLNMGLIEEVRESTITKIYCTSGFGKNNAFRLFYEGILGMKLNKEIKQNKLATLPVELFGREVVISLLPSPSGAANISLSRSIGYKESPYFGSSSAKPVHDYRVNLFRFFFSIEQG